MNKLRTNETQHISVPLDKILSNTLMGYVSKKSSEVIDPKAAIAAHIEHCKAYGTLNDGDDYLFVTMHKSVHEKNFDHKNWMREHYMPFLSPRGEVEIRIKLLSLIS